MNWTNGVRACAPEDEPEPGNVANTHPELRRDCKATRKDETDTLKAHGVTDSAGYSRCTDATYLGYFRRTARELRKLWGVPRGKSLRDRFNELDAAGVRFCEAIARARIAALGAQGPDECAAVCYEAAKAVRAALAMLR